MLHKFELLTFVFRFFISIILLGLVLAFCLHDLNRLLIALVEVYGKQNVHIDLNGSDFVFKHVGVHFNETPVHFDSMRLHSGPILILALYLGVSNLAFIARLKLIILTLAFGVIAQLLGLGFLQALVLQGWEKNWSGISLNSLMALFSIIWLLLPGIFCAVWCYLYWLPKVKVAQ